MPRLTAVLLLPLALASCGEAKAAEVTVRPVKAMIVPASVPERVLTFGSVGAQCCGEDKIGSEMRLVRPLILSRLEARKQRQRVIIISGAP